MYNLLDNAIKFTDQGKIIVRVARHESSDIVIKVEDSGRGIDPEMKNKLFVKFASKSDGGTGLGLYLAKRIVEAHGGRIWVSSGPSGSGTTFAFTLPTDLRPSDRLESQAARPQSASPTDTSKYAPREPLGTGVKKN
jgi:signal transduction histidine kinase